MLGTVILGIISANYGQQVRHIPLPIGKINIQNKKLKKDKNKIGKGSLVVHKLPYGKESI